MYKQLKILHLSALHTSAFVCTTNKGEQTNNEYVQLRTHYNHNYVVIIDTLLTSQISNIKPFDILRLSKINCFNSNIYETIVSIRIFNYSIVFIIPTINSRLFKITSDQSRI